MNPVKIISGIAAPLLRINVDTDAIIPSREIKAVSKKGLSEGLFRSGDILRFQTESQMMNLF